MVLSGAVWFYLELYSFIWSCIVLSGAVWFYLELYGFIMQHSEITPETEDIGMIIKT